MKTKFSFSKKPRTSIMHHRNLCRKKVGLGPLGFLSFLGITMGVLILMAMAAPSARAALETYYDFEDGNFTSDSPGLQTTSLALVSVGFGLFSQTGTNLNAVTPSTNMALAVFPAFLGSAGVFTLGGLTTTGLTDVNLSFAFLRGGTSSFTTLDLLYSTTGMNGTYTNFATFPNLTSYTTYTGPPTFSFDVSTLTNGAVDNVSGSNLFFEFIVNGATDFNAAIFIDNIQVTAVPEPTTWIGGALAIPFLGFVYIQRRRRAQMLRRA